MVSSMRDAFHQHHRFSDAEQDTIWSTATFAVDTNVLLNVYRYADSTREDLFRVLRAVAQRIYIPRHVAKEFYRRRLDVIQEQGDEYTKLEKQLDGFLATIRSSFHRSAFLRIADIESQLRPAVESARDLVLARRKALPNLLHNDVFLEQLADIVGTSMGDELEPAVLEKRHLEAQARIDNQVPPGFRDAKKPVPERYGDILIWFELLDLAALRKTPVVFVTDDEKDDWWQDVRGQKLGPRPELREEMRRHATVQFHIYNAARFLEKVARELRVEVSKNSIDDASRIAGERNQAADPTGPSERPPPEIPEIGAHAEGAEDMASSYDTLRRKNKERERLFLANALHAHGGNVTRTAQAIGFTREGLHKKLKAHGLRATSGT